MHMAVVLVFRANPVEERDVLEEFPELLITHTLANWTTQLSYLLHGIFTYYHAKVPHISTIRPTRAEQDLGCSELLRLDIMIMQAHRVAERSSAKVTYLQHPRAFAEAPKVGLGLIYTPSITLFVWARILPLGLDILAYD
jgi:hypothetical protein